MKVPAFASIAFLITILTACRDPPLMDSIPPDFSGPNVTASVTTTPADTYIDVTVSAQFRLNPWTSRESVHVGNVAIGFCLLPSDELLEDAECDPSTVYELPTGSGLFTDDPLSSIHDVLAPRGEPIIITHTISLTSSQQAGVTVIGAVSFPEGPNYYIEYIYSDNDERLFIRFE